MRAFISVSVFDEISCGFRPFVVVLGVSYRPPPRFKMRDSAIMLTQMLFFTTTRILHMCYMDIVRESNRTCKSVIAQLNLFGATPLIIFVD